MTIPLDGPVNLESFHDLAPKAKYQTLKRAQETWYGESRVKAVEAKDDMGAFCNVQLETYLRHIRLNKELEKAKRAMAAEVARPVGDGIAEGDAYTAPSFLQPGAAGESVQVDASLPAPNVAGGRVGFAGRSEGMTAASARCGLSLGEPSAHRQFS